MSTGVFGGAFDPPHVGHVALVRSALEQLGLERLLIVPAGDPPHKQVATTDRVRARLAELAFAGIPAVEFSLLELEPGGPRYTVDTLRRLSESHDDLTLLVGADQFAGFLSWREPGEILELARLAVAGRPGYEDERLRPVLAALARPERVSFFPIPSHPVSSEEIRTLARDGLPIEQLVPSAVADEIARLGLYLS
ncbi:MAG: nicotinate (nicotinamide) nucleotide adenylyltransferase [Gaiellaceae bacterium]|jgi:nicotinate-nucleotide adenylyltransferase